jgi:hypothetical protein
VTPMRAAHIIDYTPLLLATRTAARRSHCRL